MAMEETLRFEWDAKMARANRRKHSVRFEEPATVFGDSLGRIFDDPLNSDTERREILV